MRLGMLTSRVCSSCSIGYKCLVCAVHTLPGSLAGWQGLTGPPVIHVLTPLSLALQQQQQHPLSLLVLLGEQGFNIICSPCCSLHHSLCSVLPAHQQKQQQTVMRQQLRRLPLQIVDHCEG
jgi:hypothetical protein